LLAPIGSGGVLTTVFGINKKKRSLARLRGPLPLFEQSALATDGGRGAGKGVHDRRRTSLLVVRRRQ